MWNSNPRFTAMKENMIFLNSNEEGEGNLMLSVNEIINKGTCSFKLTWENFSHKSTYLKLKCQRRISVEKLNLLYFPFILNACRLIYLKCDIRLTK